MQSKATYEQLPPAGKEPPVIRDPAALDASFRLRATMMQADLNRVLAVIGYRSMFDETYRTDERQRWLFSIGRTHRDPLYVPAKDGKPAKGRTGIVTNVETSDGPHGRRKAFDLRYVRIDGRPARTADYVATLERFGKEAPARYGIRWGGFFATKTLSRDMPHWEDLDA